MPIITVLMSVYNGEAYLRESIESILSQTYRDLEFIIIDDGSLDNTWHILNSYAANDARIILRRSKKNIGLTRSLNQGLEIARGEYIARQDVDDISMTERFEKQVNFLNTHPDVSILGSWGEAFDDPRSALVTTRSPIQSLIIKWSLLFGNCMIHSSVVMRRSVIEGVGGYDDGLLAAQDYDLWSRVSFESHLANFPEVLVKRRLHANRVSVLNSRIQEETVIKVMNAAQSRVLGEQVSFDLTRALRGALLGLPMTSSSMVRDITLLIKELYGAFVEQHNLDKAELKWISKDAADKLYVISGQNITLSFWASLITCLDGARLDLRLPSRQAISFLRKQIAQYFSRKIDTLRAPHRS